MKKVILCPNPNKDQDLAVTKQAAALLEEAGFAAVVCPEYPDGTPQQVLFAPAATSLLDALRDAVLVVSLGGDGTFMHIARKMFGIDVPIIGVNLGTVGFLTDLDRSELPKIVQAARGEFTPSPRMMLEAAVLRNGVPIYGNHAINDVALHGVAQTIHITACGDGKRILEFSGDGIVIASPTGSTAYSLSAGGPIVEPTAENLILTPICAHALIARSFVLAPERVVTVRVSDLRCRAFVSMDGGEFEIADGDVLEVRRAAYHPVFAHVSDKAFYDIVFEKLGDAR